MKLRVGIGSEESTIVAKAEEFFTTAVQWMAMADGEDHYMIMKIVFECHFRRLGSIYL